MLKAYGGLLRRLGETDKAREVLTRFGEVVGLENEIRRYRNTLLKAPRHRDSRVGLIHALVELGHKTGYAEEVHLEESQGPLGIRVLVQGVEGFHGQII